MRSLVPVGKKKKILVDGIVCSNESFGALIEPQKKKKKKKKKKISVYKLKLVIIPARTDDHVVVYGDEGVTMHITTPVTF